MGLNAFWTLRKYTPNTYMNNEKKAGLDSKPKRINVNQTVWLSMMTSQSTELYLNHFVVFWVISQFGLKEVLPFRNKTGIYTTVKTSHLTSVTKEHRHVTVCS
jgi:hypothetical protein